VEVGESQLPMLGIIQGRSLGEERYEVLRIVEKPSAELARSSLRTPGLGEDRWLGHFGMHVFSPEIFEVLDRNIAEDVRERGEIQLTTAQEGLRARGGNYIAQVTAGRRYDTGIPYGLMETQLALALNSVHRREILAFIIDELDRGGRGPHEGQPLKFRRD